MTSIFKEIDKIRNGSSINMIEIVSNRYAVLCREMDGTKTAYCFSVPIYNIKTNEIVNLRFYHNKHGSTFIGSEAKITVADKASMINQYGRCDIVFQGSISKKTEEAIYINYNNRHMEIRPTLNGLLIIMDYGEAQSMPSLTLLLDRTFEFARANDKYFSVMREKFIPFVTVSCIGILNSYGEVIAPCEVHNQKVGEKEYVLTFSATSKTRTRIAIEVNMQETKLFQDTTVESKHPKLNNSFGGISFLGETKNFGEQWLYSRLETSNILQLQKKKPQKASFLI